MKEKDNPQIEFTKDENGMYQVNFDYRPEPDDIGNNNNQESLPDRGYGKQARKKQRRRHR